jgi:hypothetical protein
VNENTLLSRKELAGGLNVSTRTVDRWIHEGTGPPATLLPSGRGRAGPAQGRHGERLTGELWTLDRRSRLAPHSMDALPRPLHSSGNHPHSVMPDPKVAGSMAGGRTRDKTRGQGVKPVADQTSKGDIQFNRSLLVGGGVLVALGGLLGFTGMALVSSALISATRQWMDHLERPPSEIARRRWEQTKAAASAGAAAWRNGPSSS